MGSKAKGSGFEREIAAQLSLWWSDGKHDDLAWRTAGSGARATSRGKKRTTGHYGDLGPTSPAMRSFFKVFCVELKRGYKDMSPFDLLDCTKGTPEFQKWWEKAKTTTAKAKSMYPMIIYRRNQKQSIVCLPNTATRAFPSLLSGDYIEMSMMRVDDKGLFFTPLDDFLALVSPRKLIQVANA